MAELKPDPGRAPAGTSVIISAESWNAIRDSLKPIRGVAGQINVIPAGDGGQVIEFAEERLIYINENGVATPVYMPMRA